MRLVIVALLAHAVAIAPAAALLDSIVAKVDEEVVTWSEVVQERELLRVVGDLVARTDTEGIREKLVRRLLMAREAERQLLVVETRAVEEQVEQWALRGGEAFWTTLQRVGIDRPWVEARSRRMLLAEEFRRSMRDLTFVAESDIRDAYRREPEAFADRPVEETWETIRESLAETVFRQEMEQWMEKQEALGRVVRNPLPEP